MLTLDQFKKLVSDFSLNSQNRVLCAKHLELLYVHYEQLCHWNQTHKLCALSNTADDVYNHYCDSLMGRNLLQNEKSIYDAGSGAGFPGIVLATIGGDQKFHLVELIRKKASFLNFTKEKMRLENVTVCNTGIENFQNLACVISRAAFTPDFQKSLAQVIMPGGHIYSWLSETQQSLMEGACNFVKEEEIHYKLPNGKSRRIECWRKKLV